MDVDSLTKQDPGHLSFQHQSLISRFEVFDLSEQSGILDMFLCYQHPLWVLTLLTTVPSSSPLIFPVNALFCPVSILFY
jgi:hypothetical protein